MIRKAMVQVLFLALLACTCLPGCYSAGSRPHSCMDTLAETPEEHFQRVDLILDRERRALAEDLDLLFLTDRPTRLSRWHSR